MGEIIKVCCNACKKEWRCMEGSGLLYGKKESIIGAFSERERAKVTAQIEKSEIPAYDFTYRLTVCHHCKEVVNVPVLVTGEDETYVGSCPACGRRAKLLASEMEKTACPVCKSRTLKVKTVGHWD